jgi:hypothetical protein
VLRAYRLPIFDTGILTSGSADPAEPAAGVADPQSSHPPHAPADLMPAARLRKPRLKLRGPSEKSA